MWSAQDSSLLIEVVASPGPGAFSFATTVVDADDNTQRIDGYAPHWRAVVGWVGGGGWGSGCCLIQRDRSQISQATTSS